MESIPFGGLVFGAVVLLAVAPLRRPRTAAVVSWMAGSVPNEAPFAYLLVLAASHAPGLLDGDLGSTRSRAALAVALLSGLGLVVVVRRAQRAAPAVDRALDEALGSRWREEVAPALTARLRRRWPWARIALLPWPVRPRDVERVRDIPYADGGNINLLDVYRHRSRPEGAPTLIHLHGGRFRVGRKSWEGRPLLHHLARQGWTCISADYRLTPTPGAGFPGHLVDVKRVLAWVRDEGLTHGCDPDVVFLSGSSAGAHLTAMAALTAGDPRLQPGFEDADTSVTGAIGLYGYYGPLGDDHEIASTPLAHARPDAPPFFVLHGDHDTYKPVEGARELVTTLRRSSEAPVAYAELPGAQHSFDLFHSIRFEAVVDAVEAFAAWVRTARSDPEPVRTLP